MKPAPFTYVRAESLEHALDALAEHGDRARVLAGGQSLVPLLNQRRIRPEVLVDITRVGGLCAARRADGELRVGALVTQNGFEREATACPLAAEALPYTGHFATRNRGTVGGSLAYADPRGELALGLLTLGGHVIARSRRGERTIAADELLVGAFRSTLAADELLVESSWPTADPDVGHAFEELAQRHGDFTLAAAACTLRVRDGQVAEARVGVGAVDADRPRLAPAATALIEGRALDPAVAGEAGRAAAAELHSYDDLHASAAYRRHLAGRLVERALLRAWEAVT